VGAWLSSDAAGEAQWARLASVYIDGSPEQAAELLRDQLMPERRSPRGSL